MGIFWVLRKIPKSLIAVRRMKITKRTDDRELTRQNRNLPRRWPAVSLSFLAAMQPSNPRCRSRLFTVLTDAATPEFSFTSGAVRNGFRRDTVAMWLSSRYVVTSGRPVLFPVSKVLSPFCQRCQNFRMTLLDRLVWRPTSLILSPWDIKRTICIFSSKDKFVDPRVLAIFWSKYNFRDV